MDFITTCLCLYWDTLCLVHADLSPLSLTPLSGTNHYSQTDVCFVLPAFVLKMRSAFPRLDPTSSHALNMSLCHDFFKRYLIGGQRSTLCSQGAPQCVLFIHVLLEREISVKKIISLCEYSSSEPMKQQSASCIILYIASMTYHRL